MMNCFKKLVLGFLCLFFSLSAVAQVHPSLMMTRENGPAIRKGVLKYPILKNSYKMVKADADLALSQPIAVPAPTDAGGGYTHEQHKKNYTNILNCGIAYQVSGEKNMQHILPIFC